MKTILRNVRDQTGIQALQNSVRNIPELIYTVTLDASADTSLTLPQDELAWNVFFNYGGDNVWVAINDTAAVPAGDSFAASTSEQNPIGYGPLPAGTEIHVISTATASISVALYAAS